MSTNQLSFGFAQQASRSQETANGLTLKIINFIKREGWQAERISVVGRPLTQKQGGREYIIGWVQSHMTVGTADISATIKGHSVKIEVKIGKDRQSNAQINYQQDVERAGGIYYIARNFDTFLTWYRQMNF